MPTIRQYAGESANQAAQANGFADGAAARAAGYDIVLQPTNNTTGAVETRPSNNQNQQQQQQQQTQQYTFNGQTYSTYEQAIAAQNSYNTQQQQQYQTNLVNQDIKSINDSYGSRVNSDPYSRVVTGGTGVYAYLNGNWQKVNDVKSGENAVDQELLSNGNQAIFDRNLNKTSSSAYTGNSIVDYLTSVGKPTLFADRANLAKSYGIDNYTGTAAQNTQLLNLLKSNQQITNNTATNTNTNNTLNTPTNNSSVLNFRSSLSDTQKTQLQNRLERIKAGDPITQTDINNFNYGLGSSWQSYLQSAETSTSGLSQEITQSPEWVAASDQNKQIVTFATEFQQAAEAGDLAGMQDKQDALNKAIAEASPYFKQKILYLQDEISRSVGTVKGDYESSLKGYTDKIKSIQEDLTFNKENLSLEEQSDLAQQLRTYKTNLYNLQQTAAESGLAFSSPRTTAEQQLKDEQQGLVESTQRKYNKSQRDLQVGSERNTQTLQQSIADLERGKQERLTAIQRAGEMSVGSANMPTVSGVTPIGGIGGDLARQQASETKAIEQGFYNWNKIL